MFQHILVRFLWFLFDLVVCLIRSAEWLCAHVDTVPRAFLHVHEDLMVAGKTSRIPHIPKKAGIIFQVFCGQHLSLMLRKKRGFICQWRLRRKERSWEREGQGASRKTGKRKWEKASGLEIWNKELSINRVKNAVKHIVFLCFKCPVSTAVNRQAVIPPDTLDYIRVPGKLCSSWFMIPFESSERINDVICDVTHTGKQIISGRP